MLGFLNLMRSEKSFGPMYAAGTIGAFALPAIVTAPLFNGTSSLVLVPLGKIPTIFPSLIRRRGILIALGPGFSRSTGKAFNVSTNHLTNQFSNNSFFAMKWIFFGKIAMPSHKISNQPVWVQAMT